MASAQHIYAARHMWRSAAGKRRGELSSVRPSSPAGFFGMKLLLLSKVRGRRCRLLSAGGSGRAAPKRLGHKPRARLSGNGTPRLISRRWTALHGSAFFFRLFPGEHCECDREATPCCIDETHPLYMCSCCIQAKTGSEGRRKPRKPHSVQI